MNDKEILKILLKNLRTNPHPGMFINVDSLDGSGQSTQVDLICEELTHHGVKTLKTKEPTDKMIGGLIRGFLTGVWDPSPAVKQLLFTADRGQHLEREIIPQLKKGNAVVTDRYAFSTIAFGSLDLPVWWLVALNNLYLWPDPTFILKVSPGECLRRIDKGRLGKKHYFEREEMLAKSWKTYQMMAPKLSGVHVIDGEQKPEEVFEKIKKILLRYPNLK
jgi:dTMP kinase